jgi:hypothetical protein
MGTAQDTLATLDPVKVLVHEAIEVLSKEDPGWNGSEQEYKRRVIDDCKRRTLRRVHRGGYFLFSMIVKKRVLLCPVPLNAKFDLRYNPFA